MTRDDQKALEDAAKACAKAFYESEALDEPIFFETYGGRSVPSLVNEFWPEFMAETRAVLESVSGSKYAKKYGGVFSAMLEGLLRQRPDQ